MRIIVDKLPSNSSECIFRSMKGKCLIRKNQGYFSKCTLLEECKCPYLLSFDEASQWRDKVGKVPNDMERCIYQVQHGKLPPLNGDEPIFDISTPRPAQVPTTPYTFKKRKFGK